MSLAPIHTVKMTAEQYLRLGEDPPGVRLELVDGEIKVSPSAYPLHAHVIARLTKILLLHVDDAGLGQLFLDTDVAFEEYVVRRPDICFYEKAHLRRVTPTRLAPPPDLCIEVLSEGNVEDDRINKFRLYRKHKVPHYWIIDPAERTAECFALRKGRYARVSTGKGDDAVNFPPFASLTLPLAELWMPGS